MTTSTATNFQTMCRHWRQTRKLSQLDLALAANVSQRHVSWLETGRSRPSREMVMRLSEAMEIPLRERNLLFQAAGFAANYRESELDAPDMVPVREALEHILTHHSPLPAVVVDRFWNVKMKNSAADSLLGIAQGIRDIVPEVSRGDEINLALLTLHPQGLRQYMTNWEQAAPAFLRRLHNEALSTGDADMLAQFEASPASDDPEGSIPAPAIPVPAGDVAAARMSAGTGASSDLGRKAR